MLSQYRFFRVQAGIPAFADVTVETSPARAWSIGWRKGAAQYKDIYEASINKGVEIAACVHKRLDGKPMRIEIVALIETPSDTRADAVTCAAALATWKALGHPEYAAEIAFEENEWRVRFRE